LDDVWGSVPTECIKRLDGVDRGNRESSLCHNPYVCCGGNVCLVNDRSGGGGDGDWGGGEIRWDLNEACMGAGWHRPAPELGVLR